MKIGIYYDTLASKGGAEKVVVELANALKADIVTSGYIPENLILKPEYPVHDLGNFSMKLFKPIGYLFEAPLRFFLNRNKYQYDVTVYVGYTSIYAAKKSRANIWYCLTPNRIIYDLRRQKIAEQSMLGKLFLYAHILLFSSWDRKCIQRMGTIVSQTHNVRDRVKKYYDRESSVVYGPVNTKNYQSDKIGDYYLAVSRLFKEKRMDLIAEAFIGRQEKLILVGDGPQKPKLTQICNEHSNIQLYTNVDEQELIDLYKNCRATIYMPVEEDYGLVPIEGMAAGKPCIAANEGGCKETVLNERSGFLIKPNVKNIHEAMGKITDDWLRLHSKACVSQALKFDLQKFTHQWEAITKEFVSEKA